METNVNSITSLISAFEKLLKIQAGSPISIPSAIILTGTPKRSGLSATKIASRIIVRKSELGIPVGVLPSGGVAPDEMMERIRVEEIIKGFQEDAILTVAIPPGTAVSASGISPAGPVLVQGSTLTITKGFGIIQ